MRNSATKLFYLFEKKKLFFLFLNILFFINAYTQGFFELKFGSIMDDKARAVQQLIDGNIYVAGFSNAGPNGGYDISLSKIDIAGNVLWTKYFGKQYNEYLLYMNKTNDNNLILCGETHTFSDIDAWIMKLDSSGNTLWNSGITSTVNESFKYVEQTSEGGYITCGFQSDSNSSNDIFIAKFDSAGDIQWQKTYGGTDNDYADAIKQVQDGGYLISADTRSFGLPDYDIYMIKVDSAGNFLWDNLSGGPLADGCQGFIITSDFKNLTFGESFVSLALPYQYFLQLTDSAGGVIWEKTMGTSAGSDAAFSAVETTDGSFVLTGYSNSNDSNSPIDLVVFKINALGDSVWSQYYGNAGIDIGYHIIKCMGGGYLIAGTTWNNDNDYYLLKVDDSGLVSTPDADGSISSVKIYPNPSDGMFNVIFPKMILNPAVRIYDYSGAMVFEENFNTYTNAIEIKTSKLSGLYFIHVKTQDQTFYSKLKIGE